ncbi:conjugal transfer protein TraX [Acinetobacter sp. NIPH 1852]|uniref:TraX family protein n=1 Tax=Acinetobacter sp. NIPH 1852 TaxID=2923428 RepID=UPI001F4B25B7|nr:TraX family protein [Acinetobacter sp. NIPH 1852]MCH7308211.1 conjugal transfer protein TraX [Acinetobacter sp. NIPH 1852]
MHKKINFLHLKIIAIVAMTIDHFAWLFIETGTFEGQLLHFIGRITAPMMCFLLVEGYFHSKDIKVYAIRLFGFAVISQLPFVAMFEGWDVILSHPEILFYKFNILFNLLLGLLSLIVWHARLSLAIKIVLTTLFLLLSIEMDWGVFITGFVLVLAYFRENRNQQIIAYLIAAMAMLLLVDLGFIHALPTLVLQWMPIGILTVPIFWWLCNYQFGDRFGGRYFFYLYYPVHMLVLSLFKLL